MCEEGGRVALVRLRVRLREGKGGGRRGVVLLERWQRGGGKTRMGGGRVGGWGGEGGMTRAGDWGKDWGWRGVVV